VDPRHPGPAPGDPRGASRAGTPSALLSVEGIEAAIKTFWSADKKISIYVLGDEFTGDSIDEVLETVDRLNRRDASGQRKVRIHRDRLPDAVLPVAVHRAHRHPLPPC